MIKFEVPMDDRELENCLKSIVVEIHEKYPDFARFTTLTAQDIQKQYPNEADFNLLLEQQIIPAQREFKTQFQILFSKCSFERQMEIIYLFREVAFKNWGDEKIADELTVAAIRGLELEYTREALQIFLNRNKRICSSGFRPPGCGQPYDGQAKHYNLITCKTITCKSYGREFRECVGHTCSE